jgi:hypothetical protein
MTDVAWDVVPVGADDFTAPGSTLCHDGDEVPDARVFSLSASACAIAFFKNSRTSGDTLPVLKLARSNTPRGAAMPVDDRSCEKRVTVF